MQYLMETLMKLLSCIFLPVCIFATYKMYIIYFCWIYYWIYFYDLNLFFIIHCCLATWGNLALGRSAVMKCRLVDASNYKDGPGAVDGITTQTSVTSGNGRNLCLSNIESVVAFFQKSALLPALLPQNGKLHWKRQLATFGKTWFSITLYCSPVAVDHS